MKLEVCNSQHNDIPNAMIFTFQKKPIWINSIFLKKKKKTHKAKRVFGDRAITSASGSVIIPQKRDEIGARWNHPFFFIITYLTGGKFYSAPTYVLLTLYPPFQLIVMIEKKLAVRSCQIRIQRPKSIYGTGPLAGPNPPPTPPQSKRKDKTIR